MYIVWIYYERTWHYTAGECHQGMETCSHVKVFFSEIAIILLTAATKKHLQHLRIPALVGGQIREKQGHTQEHYPRG